MIKKLSLDSTLTEEFYGGQGTINVLSWNPKSTKFTCVRYAMEDI